MERTAEEFVHQLPQDDDAPLPRSWFVGDFLRTERGEAIYMTTRGAEVRLSRIYSGAATLYASKSSAKRAAQRWLEKTLDRFAGESDEPLPPCAIAMKCLCAGHASGLGADQPCDTSEERARARISAAEAPAHDSDDCQKDPCGLCQAREHVAVINVRLEVQGLAGAALDIVDRVLDNGDFQDAINEYVGGDEMVTVLDASVSEEVADPPPVERPGRGRCPCFDLGVLINFNDSRHDPLFYTSMCSDHPLDVDPKNSVDENEAAACQAEACLEALADVRDMLWRPGFPSTDESDEELKQVSDTLRAIMDRLAFLKPGRGQ